MGLFSKLFGRKKNNTDRQIITTRQPVTSATKKFESAVVKRLNTVDHNTVPKVPYTDQLYECRIVDVYDGDTITVIISPKAGDFIKLSIRIIGIDTPEIRTKNADEKQAAILIRDNIRSFLMNKICWLDIECYDKYGGRMVGDIYIDSTSKLSTYNLEKGFAKPFTGKTKKIVWTTPELQTIINKLK